MMVGTSIIVVAGLLLLLVFVLELRPDRTARIRAAVWATPHRWAAVASLLSAGLLMPPDTMSQATLALPLFATLEAALWAVRFPR
jgi:Sec-independent protein secretion pathway component TatC